MIHVLRATLLERNRVGPAKQPGRAPPTNTGFETSADRFTSDDLDTGCGTEAEELMLGSHK